MDWNNFLFLTFIKTGESADINSIGSRLTQISHKNRLQDNTSYTLRRLKDLHFETDVADSAIEHGNLTVLRIFTILGILILATACINYVNLTTAKASARSKEVSIRKIIGASKKSLFGQFLLESFIISLLALSLAVVLIMVCFPWYTEITGKQFVRPFESLNVWLTLGASLFISFLANGIYPAVLISSFEPLNVFRGKTVLKIKDKILRKGLVVAQFTISVILIISATIIHRQLKYVQQINLGYDRNNVFALTIPFTDLSDDRQKNNSLLSSMKSDLLRLSSINEVSLTGSHSIYNHTASSSGSLDWSGRPKAFNPEVATLSADEDFASLMKIKMTEGRWFTSSPFDKHNFVLNETAAKLFNIGEPVVGQRLILDNDTGVIIGVTGDFHYRSLHDKIGPMVINRQVTFSPTFYLRIPPSNTADAIEACQKVWAKYISDAPMDVTFIDEGYNQLYHLELSYLNLITIFSVIAISISILGLLGLAAFAAEQKVKEIGIRKVLGANTISIVGLLSRDFVKMIALASAIAFPISWISMSRWLDNYAYRIDLSIWPFLLALMIVVLLSFLTVGIQTIKAALSNPVDSLKRER